MTKDDPQYLEFRELCGQRKLAATVQRFIVYQTLAGMKNHPTADMIYEQLHPENQKVSRMSVYRILDTFSRCRMIRRLNHPGAATHYDAFMTPHHHLICVNCGSVLDVDRSEGEHINISECQIPPGYQILDTTVDIQGICPDCGAEIQDFLKPGRDN
ncbi:MAG: transcriptional repressor [Planctomycetia bacterium]|nr:transcriptional repressor [Planctomycetia bacterium]